MHKDKHIGSLPHTIYKNTTGWIKHGDKNVKTYRRKRRRVSLGFWNRKYNFSELLAMKEVGIFIYINIRSFVYRKTHKGQNSFVGSDILLVLMNIHESRNCQYPASIIKQDREFHP